MKKMLGLVLMSVLCVGMVMPISAEEGKTGTVIKNDTDGTVPGEGTIGIEKDTINDWIDITIPSKFEWAAYAAEYTTTDDVVVPAGDVISANYEIKNNIERSNVKVTLKSFHQNETVTNYNPEELKLYLTGDLGKDVLNERNIAGNYTNDDNKAYSALLDGKEDPIWEFGFKGHYSGKFYPTAMVPNYTMLLHFNLESIDGVE